MNLIFLYVGVAGLITTGTLAIVKKATISQRAQALLPRWADWIVGIGGVLALCYFQPDLQLDPWIFGYWCMFWGHIWIANKERYQK